jgi:hypothetical protein
VRDVTESPQWPHWGDALMSATIKKPTGIDLMGWTNVGWGVCGFTSSFYAIYELDPGKQAQLGGAGIAYRVLAEIKTYLRTLKAAGQNGVLRDIANFTSSFPGYEDFTIESYIDHINDSVDQKEEDITSDAKYSIALPPQAVVDYLARTWNQNATWSYTGTVADGIVGVKDPNDKNMVQYQGLRHYLYRKNNKFRSWGESFDDLDEVNSRKGKNYAMCCVIAF